LTSLILNGFAFNALHPSQVKFEKLLMSQVGQQEVLIQLLVKKGSPFLLLSLLNSNHGDDFGQID
jgi:hypothetical protein